MNDPKEVILGLVVAVIMACFYVWMFVCGYTSLVSYKAWSVMHLLTWCGVVYAGLMTLFFVGAVMYLCWYVFRELF